MRELVVAMFASVAECTATRRTGIEDAARTALLRVPDPREILVDQHDRRRDPATGRFLTPAEILDSWVWGTRGYGPTDELAALDAGEAMARMIERDYL